MKMFLSWGSLIAAGVIGCGVYGSLANGSAFYEDQTLKTIDFIESVFGSSYAPKEWKAKYANWRLEQEAEKARLAVHEKGAHLELIEGQKVISQLFGSTQDYHVSVRFHHTERATLPIEIRSGAGHFFIAWIDRDKLPKETFPLLVGDKVIGINGRPVADELKAVLGEFSHNVPGTDGKLGEIFLTHRGASRGMNVPRGPVDIEVRRTKKDDKTQNEVTEKISHQLIWDYHAEEISLQPEEVFQPSGYEKSRRGFRDQWQTKELHSSLFNKNMTLGLWNSNDFLAEGENENPHWLGAKKSFLPKLGIQIWEEEKDKNFHAYIFRSEKGGVYGYIRIAAYDGSPDKAKEFLAIIKRMEEQTDALVIDQLNNPGGSVFYLYSLASMLALPQTPLSTPRHRVAITQADVAEALGTLADIDKIKNQKDAIEKMGETIDGYPVTYQVSQFFKENARFIIDQWKKGARLSSPFYLGIDKIMPHPEVHYTKPILVLINELDFSGGDFFPAILQDNHRATLMGARTAGAGGYVLSIRYRNLLGLDSFSVTGSIAERVDLNPIENLGVRPDVPYDLQEEDFKEDFKPYKQKILDQLKLMTEKN